MFDIRRYKNIIFLLWLIVIGFTIYVIYSTFFVSNKILIKSDDLTRLKNSISETNSKYLFLDSIEGDKNFLSLRFKDERFDGQEYSYYSIYDIENKKIINNVTKDKFDLNIRDASLIKHIKKDLYIVVDASGNVFKYYAKENKLDIIDKTNITKDRFFKSIYKDSSLYIISRTNLNNYNEKSLSDYSVHKITVNSDRKETTTVTEYTLPYDFIYSFVVDENKGVGVVGSSVEKVHYNSIVPLATTKELLSIQERPIDKQEVKFTKKNTLSIKFLDSNEEVPLDNKLVKESKNLLYDSINSKLNTDIIDPVNIPLYIQETKTFFSTESYDDMLLDFTVRPSVELCALRANDNYIEEFKIPIRGDILLFDKKGYKFFIRTADGLVGITNKDSVETIVNSNVVYMNEDIFVYEEDGNIMYK
ncbi:hypothetical protein ACV3UL_07535 [Clostridium perfringens]